MPRKRTPKEKRHLRAHAARRLKERHGLPRHKIDEINRQITSGEAEFLWRESGTRTHWLVNVNDTEIVAVYHKPTHFVCTVLPPDAITEYYE